MEGSKRMNIWACVVFIGLYCVFAQQEQTVCVPYYLCDSNNTVITDGRGLILIDRSNFCSNPLEVRCSVLPRVRNRRSTEVSEEMTQLPQWPDNTSKIVIPSTGCGVRRKIQTLPPLDDEYGVSTGDTNYAEFPWVVALLKKGKDGNQTTLKCGASLIDRQVVVTAAHCVAGIDKNAFTARAGDWDLHSKSEPLPNQDRSIQRVIIHPEFNPRNLQNDIALLIVNSSFELTKNVDIICLPHPDAVFDKARCVVAGWRESSIGNDADERILVKVDLGFIPNNTCQEQLRKQAGDENFTLDESSICTEGEAGRNACQANDGSPLMCPFAEDTKHWVQVGIVSWSFGCTSKTPTVYTSMSHFLEWILR